MLQNQEQQIVEEREEEQRVLIKVDKNKANASSFTWTELVHEADFVFDRDGQSQGGVVKFLEALSKFNRLPKVYSMYDIQKFSFLFQQGIIERLPSFSEENQRKIHYFACLILIKQFKQKNKLLSLSIRKESVRMLLFSKYLEDPNLPDEHLKAVRACAKLFLARLAHIPPSLILSELSHLDFFSREDYIEQHDLNDKLEKRLAKLEKNQTVKVEVALKDAVSRLESMRTEMSTLMDTLRGET